jgi:hypothetical protein
MTNPDADEPHAIADTQMFRRFVDEGSTAAAPTEAKTFWMWTWPGLLVPIIVSIIIVGALIALLTS